MAGELKVESEKGKGSRFWFEISLPVIESASTTDEIAERERLITGYEGKIRRILVVDDKEENRLVLQNMLEPLGFEISLAANGQEEIELASQMQPDCILTDLVMPVKTGLEAIREIRQIPELKNTVIIAISASVLNPDESQIVGCQAFLQKPVNEKQLLDLLKQHLHLDWMYEATTEFNLFHLAQQNSLNRTFVAPPPEEMAILYKLAMLGSMKKIRQRATYLEELDERYAPLAAQLKDLAQGFQEKEIVNLVKQYLPQK